MHRYLLIIAACYSIKAADTKGIEIQLKSLCAQIVLQDRLVAEALDCFQDSRDELDKTIYMKEFLARKNALKDLQEELLTLQSKHKSKVKR